jgi:hypothetical protein
VRAAGCLTLAIWGCGQNSTAIVMPAAIDAGGAAFDLAAADDRPGRDLAGPLDFAGVAPDLAPPATADLSAPSMSPPTTAVLTFHNDNQRSGAQLRESTLTPMAVLTHGMRILVTRPIDGPSLGQVLYAPGLVIGGQSYDAFFAATLKNSVYAYDAGNAAATGTSTGLLWKTSLVDPESTTRVYRRGVMSTPVIDREAGELYVVYSTKDVAVEPDTESTVDVAFWLAALDLATGAVKRQVKLAGGVTRADGTQLDFLARNHYNRPGLLLANGVVYAGFGTRPKERYVEYHGWLLGWDAKTFAPRGVFCVTPNSTMPGNGGGIWQGGAAPVADTQGNVYLITGNANRDPGSDWYGNSFLKLTQSGDAITLAASFGPSDPQNRLQLNDVDLGSGGALLLPGTRRIVGGGKTGILYLLDADTLGEEQEFQGFVNVYDPTFVVDSDWEGGPHLHGGPVAWQGGDANLVRFYGWAENDRLKAYVYDRAADQFAPGSPIAGSVVSPQDIMPGGMISLSADGNQAGSGIIWAILPKDANLDGRLLAFDAETLALLWESDYPADHALLVKWIPPTIADGKVFVPTASQQVLVYTLGN